MEDQLTVARCVRLDLSDSELRVTSDHLWRDERRTPLVERVYGNRKV